MKYIILTPKLGEPYFWDASKKLPKGKLAKRIAVAGALAQRPEYDVLVFASVSDNGMLRLRNSVKELMEDDEGRDETPAGDLPALEHAEFMRARASKMKVFLCEAVSDGHGVIARTYLGHEDFYPKADQYAAKVYMSEMDSPTDLNTAVFWIRTKPGIIDAAGWFPDAYEFANENLGDGWDPKDA
jgi:hypothetical protein